MHIVYCLPRNNVVQGVFAGLDGRHIFCSVFSRYDEYSGERGVEEYCIYEGAVLVQGRNSERDAQDIARKWSVLKPTEDVYVAKIESVFSAPYSEPKQTKVTEKGVLPA